MSLTYSGVIVILLGQLFSSMGLTVADADLTGFVNVATLLVGAVMSLYGRYRLGGVDAFGVRK